MAEMEAHHQADDLTAERAEELCFKLALLVDTGTHLEVDTEAMEAIAQALKTARQEALREVVTIIRRAETWSPQAVLAILECLARDTKPDRLASEGG